ncbi:hypothetical protein EDM58_23240 [Brevibacillus panacihumi]|uniref:TnsE C-terminal domain-containing protein n=2 Tax=Brevibacillus panacihumi TaxID=497735 RepID=A0A3M8C664_9BACL|nr:hypothetical protein EDM58_23240 [Brevibacillus panacihumi]
MQTIPVSEGIGLEEFFRVIQKLTEIYPASVQMSVLPLPLGRRFSVCGNVIRRTCTVVKLATENAIKYVIEIARSDCWSISTLILNPSDQSTRKIEYYIGILLEGLVNKSGHWDQDVLDQCIDLNIEKLRHYGTVGIKIN